MFETLPAYLPSLVALLAGYLLQSVTSRNTRIEVLEKDVIALKEQLKYAIAMLEDIKEELHK